MLANLRRSAVAIVCITVVFGFLYMFAGTGISQLLFKNQADGSLSANGSTLIGQNWSVMTTFDGKSAFPEDHALALGPGGGTFTGPGRHILHKSDLVFGIGCSLTKHGIATPGIPPGKKIIHATNDTRDLHKAFAADLGILGDAKLVIGQLIEAVRDRLGGKARASNGVAQELASEREEPLPR